ncbi:MAG: Ig-like domain-containing protein [Candidatus Marinimicrobia bacterium]|nr:Ig-like domain-containing protein [Candidatus Neomarinimicrobiota bacterium]MDD3965710.1 Ig-like domain-containing protein [Candidatus Neomarinimicrobiota bacterium]
MSFCFRCASEGLPGGGPPDKEPPRLILAVPVSGTVGVDSLQTLEFIFSETLNASVAEKNITLFPLGATETRIRVRGRSIQIQPLEPWKKNTVYTLILGKNIADLRNNAIPAPIQISFTRELQIPENSIRGKVVALQEGLVAGIYISRRHSHPDSILAYPEYYTQAAANGSFAFRYLPQEKFYIAGYVDLDKSNTYQPRSDGRLIPQHPYALPDTLESTSFSLLAVHDNFLPPRLLKAQNLHSAATKLEFSKKPDPHGKADAFRITGTEIDTVIYADKSCTLYHGKTESDTLLLHIRGLKDYLQCSMRDSSLKIPQKAPEDTLYRFEQSEKLLIIAPPPESPRLAGKFESVKDTLPLTLVRLVHGIYRIPEHTENRQGHFRIDMPLPPDYPEFAVDTLYRVPMNLSGREDGGTVSGKIGTGSAEPWRMVLENASRRYETSCNDGAFMFSDVLPGSYLLSVYSDRNGNGRLDPGSPRPFMRPEIPVALESGIDVRGRWDTVLSGTYEIEVEKSF